MPGQRYPFLRANEVRSGGADPDTPLIAVTAVIVVGSALAIGSVHLSVLLVVAALVAITPFLGPRRRRGSEGTMPTPAWVAALLAGYSLLQTVPLPVSLLAVVAPANADAWIHALPHAELVRWAPLSLDPGASTVEALKFAIYAGVFVAAFRIAENKGGSVVMSIVFFSAVAAALATIIHGLFDMTRVWGIYKPTFWQTRWHIGPLLNPNNLAGYLNLGALVGIGLALMRRPVLPRWLLSLGIAVLVATEIIAASRGGLAALLVGLLLIAGWLRLSRHAGRSDFRVAALVGGAVVGGAALALLGGDRALWAELYDKNIDKLSMISWAVPLVREHPWFGIGRGAFESVFPAYRSDSGNRIYTHAENLVVQWVAEWGVVVGVAALIAFVVTLKPWLWRSREPSLAAAATIGAAVLVLQNMVDLGLEIPAISIAFVVVLGAAWGDTRVGRSRSEGARARPRGPVPLLLMPPLRQLVLPSAIVAFAALALWRGSHGVADDRDDLHERFETLDVRRHADVVALREGIRAMISRHPAEPYFSLVGATLAYAAGDEDPLPWLQRTLERARSNGRAHLLLAEVLRARHATSQVMLEIRLAVADEPALAPMAAALALDTSTDLALLAEAVPEGLAGAPMLGALAELAMQRSKLELAAALDKLLLGRDPMDPGAHARAARRLVASVAAKRLACDTGSPCDVELELHLAALAARTPKRSTAAVIRAEMLVARGEPARADQLLKRHCLQVDDPGQCASARASVAAALPESEPLAAATRDLLLVACTDAQSCAVAASFAGDLRARRGDWATAAALYARAVRETPNEQRYRTLGVAASHAGLHGQAIDALERALALHGQADATLAREIENERAQLHPVLGVP